MPVLQQKIFHFVNPWYLVTNQHYLAAWILATKSYYLTFKGIKLYIPFCTIYITNINKLLQIMAGS